MESNTMNVFPFGGKLESDITHFPGYAVPLVARMSSKLLQR